MQSVSAFICSMLESILFPLRLAATLFVSPHESVFLPLRIDSDFGTNTMFERHLLPAEAGECLCACVLPYLCVDPTAPA